MRQDDASIRPRAVVADDHGLVRSAVVELLGELGVDVVAEATNGVECVALCKAHRPDLLTLDAGMPLLNGMDAFCEVKRWSPDTRVCLLTGFTAAGSLMIWVTAGVQGMVLKSADKDELKMTFRKVLDGEAFIAPSVEERICAATAVTSLTTRELQVLGLIATGLNNGEVASQLSISPKTVDNHRTRMMQKLGVRGVGQLVSFALREGLLDHTAQL